MLIDCIKKEGITLDDQIEDVKECIILMRGLTERQKIEVNAMLRGMRAMKEIMMAGE